LVLCLAASFSVVYSARSARSPKSSQTEIFSDVTQQAGISWRQFSGESPDRFLIETMGGGVAFLDFDGDGLQDLLFINGGETPRGKSSSPVRNALYRNLGGGKFQDVSAKSGTDRLEFYGMGVAVGDFVGTS
jgi:enediyne biosynthesis protein E4